MRIAGGILGIIGGLLGVGEAIVTPFFGAVGAEGGNPVIGLGWGGLLLSCMSLVFAVVAFARPRGAGLGLMVSSVLGMLFGGTIVAICMVLSLVGGILAFIDGRRSVVAGGSPKDQETLYLVGAAVVAVLAIASLSNIKERGTGAATSDPLTVLQEDVPADAKDAAGAAVAIASDAPEETMSEEARIEERRAWLESCPDGIRTAECGPDGEITTSAAQPNDSLKGASVPPDGAAANKENAEARTAKGI